MRFSSWVLISAIGCVEAFPTVETPVDAAVDACAPTVERCNGQDDDCDGRVDEALVPRPCEGQRGVCLGAESRCVDGAWSPCDGALHAGERWTLTEDRAWCDGLDNDCDGQTDEACDCVDGATQSCGNETAPCEPGTQLCAEGGWGECVGGIPPGRETCNGLDDDCDAIVDEGVLNACGDCGAVPDEVCDDFDDDCDGMVDEGVLNACGACGPVPDEACNGLDDDCDGAADEGVLNACGACGPVPDEACGDGVDNDCDGAIDEGVPEVCNGVDDDCDAVIDNIAPLFCRADRVAPCDRGFSVCSAGVRTCRSSCDDDEG